MIRFLIYAAIFLGSAALALWLTGIVLEDFSITLEALIVAAVIFAVIQALLSPFILKMTARYASAFIGGVGLLSTFIALWLTSIFVDGLEITGGAVTWVLATLMVWLITALATWVLPMIFIKKAVTNN